MTTSSLAEDVRAKSLQTINDLAARIAKFRYHFKDEIELQNSIAKALDSFAPKREYILSRRDRPDFWIQGVAIEVKIKGSMSSVLLQLERYAQHAQTNGILLVTTRRQHALVMPESINGKPAKAVCLSSL